MSWSLRDFAGVDGKQDVRIATTYIIRIDLFPTRFAARISH